MIKTWHCCEAEAGLQERAVAPDSSEPSGPMVGPE